ncbi:MAG: aminotransferase class IV [Clostridia bacterium]|nr:aminotransferase class IV [Clostridia bacterium]
MAYPMIENNLSNILMIDGRLVSSNSETAMEYFEPCYDTIYYETVRIYKGVLLFLEDHLDRLSNSVKASEGFYVDTKYLRFALLNYLNALALGEYEGNMRVVITREHTLFHICEANIPSKEVFEKGIATNILQWERVAPHVKIFRTEYKDAVAKKFTEATPYGMPYEVLLENKQGEITEGSKSNFFAIVDGEIYSAPNDLILIGITRKYVLEALQKAGLELRYKTFSLKQLMDPEHKVAVFVSSTPFDILPISSINEVQFDSVNDELVIKIQQMYKEIVENYYEQHKND